MMKFPEYFSRSPAEALAQGYIGVPIFFVISGFIITVVSLKADMTPTLGLHHYFLKRFTRIVPFMWVCIFAYALVRFLGTRQSDILPALRAAVLWPVGEIRPNVLWTLRHELLFYCIFALTALQGRRQWALLLWFTSPLALGLVDLIHPAWRAAVPAVWIELIQLITNPVNLCFGLGYLFGIFWLRTRWPLQINYPGGFIFAIAASFLMFALVVALDLPRDLRGYILLAPMSLALVASCAFLRKDDSLTSKIGILLGNASYSIYLVHNLILLILLEGASRLTPNIDIAVALSLFVLTAVAGGIVVHVLVEQPLIRWSAKILAPLIHAPKASENQQ